MKSQRQTAEARGSSEGPLVTHILPASATMVGVCVTAIGLVRLLETSAAVSTVLDKVLAGDSVLFLGAAFTSYLSIRSRRAKRRLETCADIAFLLALFVLAAVAVMVAWEVGVTPSR